MNYIPKRKIDELKLRELGFPESFIKEAKMREQSGLLDIEPPIDLIDRVMKKCSPLFEEHQSKRDVETNFFYRSVNKIYNYLTYYFNKK